MRSLSAFAVLFTVFFLLVSAAQAWDAPGHQWLASQVCKDFGCKCPVADAAVVPDSVFRDNINHHCYNASVPCPSGSWTCPQEDDCPALEKAEEWIDKGVNKTGCDRWYSLAVASHYFFDSKVFWHTVQGEASGCHSGFESEVGKKIGQGNWQVSKCGAAVSSSDFPGWISEFEAKLKTAGIEPEKKGANEFAVWMAGIAILGAAIATVFSKIRKKKRQ